MTITRSVEVELDRSTWTTNGRSVPGALENAAIHSPWNANLLEVLASLAMWTDRKSVV